MLDIDQLLADLNAALDKHGARIYVFGYEAECWINSVEDDWPHEVARPYIHGKFEVLD